MSAFFIFEEISQKWRQLKTLKTWDFCPQWIFTVAPTLFEPSPLDGRNLETRQIDVREILFRGFYYIDRSTTCSADIPSFRSKLSRTLWSIIRWFDSVEKWAKWAVPKNPLRRFYYLYRSQYFDLSWPSIHILVRIIESFFDDLLLVEQRWNANLAQFRSQFSNPVSQLYTRVCHVRLIAKLTKNHSQFYDFALLEYGNRNRNSWCISKGWSLILPVCESKLISFFWT